MLTFKDDSIASTFIDSVSIPDEARPRSVRIIRDYGMFDRRESRSTSLRDRRFEANQF
jgi:hypothetical protein